MQLARYMQMQVVCMYICMYVRVYVCMCTYVCVYACMWYIKQVLSNLINFCFSIFGIIVIEYFLDFLGQHPLHFSSMEVLNIPLLDYLIKARSSLHGRSQDFFSGGETLFQKNFEKILKTIFTKF